VTTVSVKIERAGSNDRLYLHNGLWGPATTVFHAFYHGCSDGTITGNWSPAHVDATTSGAIVRDALTRIDKFDPTYRRADDEERLGLPTAAAAAPGARAISNARDAPTRRAASSRP